MSRVQCLQLLNNIIDDEQTFHNKEKIVKPILPEDSDYNQ